MTEIEELKASLATAQKEIEGYKLGEQIFRATETEHHLEITALTLERDALREALTNCREAIFSPLNKESIVCTVWHGKAETLVDYIDAALAREDQPMFPALSPPPETEG